MTTIHQEIQLPGSPARVYSALVESGRFAEMTGAPASGDSVEGSAFSAFGGHVTGRHVELVPGQRVVQAWRAKTWPEGMYSIARFELRPDPRGTRLVFDHSGFPEDLREHLDRGWTANYWQNLEKYLS